MAYLLHLPNMVLEVADVCSSIPAIAALLALGVAYAAMIRRPAMVRVLLIVATLPLAIGSNIIRITTTAAAGLLRGAVDPGDRVSSLQRHGEFHAHVPAADASGHHDRHGLEEASPVTRSPTLLALTLGLLAVAGALLVVPSLAREVPLVAPLDTLPASFGRLGRVERRPE